MNQTNQTPPANPSPWSSSSAKKRRIIKKAQKCSLFQKSFRRGYSFSKVRKESRFQSQSKHTKTYRSQLDASLPSIYSKWVEANPSILKQSISSFISQFPILPSVDELFSLSSQISLEPNIDFEYLLRYAKTCSLLDYSQFHTILLYGESQAGLTIVRKEQALENACIIGMQLSKCEASLCEKRSVFMEKLAENESKYDHSIGRMSSISKQLAFSYRTYLEIRNQICATLNNYFPDLPSLQTQLQYANSCYSRILINKNLRHAFADFQLEPLNYFKLRQCIQAERIQEFKSFSSLHQFQNFMKKRKPKRSRKHTLATPCSVCLSDYHQLNNPLKNCEACGIRAHRLCYSFERKRCGFCTFQRSQRQAKQQLQSCVICRKAGLMVIKIDDLLFAHGFCLLVHGFWGIKARPNLSDFYVNNPHLKGQAQQKCPYEFGNFNQQMEIEFYNPKKHTSIMFQENENTRKLQHCSDSLSVDLNLPLFQTYNSLVYSSSEKQEKQFDKNTAKNLCFECKLPINLNLSLTCSCCAKEYHSLCSYLAGFKMTIQEGQFKGGVQNLPLLDCCSKDYSKVGWNRRFRLNYQNCAFQIKGHELAAKLQPVVQLEASQSFLK